MLVRTFEAARKWFEAVILASSRLLMKLLGTSSQVPWATSDLVLSPQTVVKHITTTLPWRAVVECLPQYRGVAGLSLFRITYCPLARHINPSLVMQPRKTCPDITKIVDWDVKNKIKPKPHSFPLYIRALVQGKSDQTGWAILGLITVAPNTNLSDFNQSSRKCRIRCIFTPIFGFVHLNCPALDSNLRLTFFCWWVSNR